MATFRSRRWWALGAACLAVLAVGIDSTVLSIALPTLAGALHASESDLQWFSAAYLLATSAAMLPAGLLGDRFGRKKVLLTSLSLFGTGSAVCAYSSSVDEFMAARVFLGMAGAGIIVMAVSALTVLFSEQERPKAVGIWAVANFLALPVGPLLGGWLLTNYWWGWVFLINVPIVVIGLAVGATLIPETRASKQPGLDPIGVVASAGGLVAMTYGLIEVGHNGWNDMGALLLIVLGIAILVAFFRWERRLSQRPGGEPLLNLTLFRSASFTWGVILMSVAVLAMIGVLFTAPQYFQGVLGTTPMGSGLRLLPLIGGLVMGAIPAAQIVHRAGAKVAVASGFFLLAVGLLLGSMTTIGSSGSFILIWMLIVGMGMGLAMATSSSTALVELSEEHSGVGSAVLQALKSVGGPFGAAVFGSILVSGYLTKVDVAGLSTSAVATVRQGVFGGVTVAHHINSDSLLESVRSAFVHGMDLALSVAVVIALVGVVLAVIFLPRTRTRREPMQLPRTPEEGEHDRTE